MDQERRDGLDILPSDDPLAAVRERLADLHRQVSEEEFRTREICERLKQFDDEDGIREEWRKFDMRVAQMRGEIWSVTEAIAHASSYWLPPVSPPAQGRP
jgi:hypothetical protein